MGLKRLIALALLAGAAIPVRAADAPAPGSPQAAPKLPQEYHCPPTAIHFMPPISDDRRESCSKDYIAWVQAHCPNSQIVY
jgi:hypothetical protein